MIADALDGLGPQSDRMKRDMAGLQLLEPVAELRADDMRTGRPSDNFGDTAALGPGDTNLARKVRQLLRRQVFTALQPDDYKIAFLVIW